MESIMRFITPKSNTAYIDDKSSVRQALEKMRHHGYNALPVIDDGGVYVGTLTEGDFLWHLVNSRKPDLKDQEETPVHTLIRTEWTPAVRADATMADLLEHVEERNFAPVVDDRGCFIGLITRKAVLSYFAKLHAERDTRVAL